MKYLFILICLFLLCCRAEEKKGGIKAENQLANTDTVPNHIQIWCMYKRTGFQGDTMITSQNKIIIKDDSLITYTINGSVVYQDMNYKPVHYGRGKVNTGYSFPKIAIGDSLNLLMYYPGGQDGDQEYYKLCK